MCWIAHWLWALLALPPALWIYSGVTSDDPRIINILVHPAGEWAARLLIITLLATPLTLLLKGWRGPLGLKKNRRYLDVAAFGYAVLHTLFYLIDKGSMDKILGELDHTYIWTGWIAFAIFVPLANTSMDYFLRVTGRHWKTLQRTTYVAAVFTAGSLGCAARLGTSRSGHCPLGPPRSLESIPGLVPEPLPLQKRFGLRQTTWASSPNKKGPPESGPFRFLLTTLTSSARREFLSEALLASGPLALPGLPLPSSSSCSRSAPT